MRKRRRRPGAEGRAGGTCSAGHWPRRSGPRTWTPCSAAPCPWRPGPAEGGAAEPGPHRQVLGAPHPSPLLLRREPSSVLRAPLPCSPQQVPLFLPSTVHRGNASIFFLPASLGPNTAAWWASVGRALLLPGTLHQFSKSASTPPNNRLKLPLLRDPLIRSASHQKLNSLLFCEANPTRLCASWLCTLGLPLALYSGNHMRC